MFTVRSGSSVSYTHLDVYKRQDPNSVIYCLKLAAIMVKELAGGTISSEIKDVYTTPAQDFIVDLSYEKVHSLIGKVIPVETIKSIVTSLEMKITNETVEGLTLACLLYTSRCV